MGSKVSTISAEYFWSYSSRQQDEQNYSFVQCLYGKLITGTDLIYHKSLVQEAMKLRLCHCVQGIHKGEVFGIYLPHAF